ncbi:MAG: cytochrome c-type biogenesis protein CcmH [Gammaproteobacteria bacterium]
MAIPVNAKEATPMAADPEMEKLVNEISAELRCLVCQNQTIADSHAALAVDLKNQVREMVKQGKSRDDVVDYMVERYGDFVRYRPPVKPTTYLLWVGPFLLLAGGLIILVVNLRKRKATVTEAPLSEEEHQKLDSILHSANKTPENKEGEGR